MEEEQVGAVVKYEPPSALSADTAGALERLPDIEITTTGELVEATPQRSVWQRFVLPVLGAIADVAVREVLPIVVNNLSSSKPSAQAERSATAPVKIASDTGGHRHRHGQVGHNR